MDVDPPPPELLTLNHIPNDLLPLITRQLGSDKLIQFAQASKSIPRRLIETNLLKERRVIPRTFGNYESVNPEATCGDDAELFHLLIRIYFLDQNPTALDTGYR